MLRACLLLFLGFPVFAQDVLYAAASFSNTYVVGGKVSPGGLFRRAADGSWTHAGYNVPILTTLAFDPEHPDTILLAGGNGLIRATESGDRWTILTSWDVTELRDVVITETGDLYFTHSRGIRVSHDHGNTWTELAATLRRKFTETLRVMPGGALIAGTEDGLWRSDDQGESWQLAGASGFQILRLEASPHEPCRLLASAQEGGLFHSRDCGRTFESGGPLGVGRNLYDIAFDPTVRGRIAAGGFGPGVAVSTDDGRTWTLRNAGLPTHEVTSLAFDPGKSGRLFAALHENALYVSDDAGISWTRSGMEGSHISCLRFHREVRR